MHINRKELRRRIINPQFDKYRSIWGLKDLWGDKKRKYWYTMRSRYINPVYYKITLRGNHIKLYSTQYIQDGQRVNAFVTGIMLGFSNSPDEARRKACEIITQTTLECTYGLNEYDKFMEHFASVVENNQNDEAQE